MNSWLNSVFDTKDKSGVPNGRIIRVWEEGDLPLDYGPKQVYVTTLLPGTTKGPHLHHKRDSLFCCVQGTIEIVTKDKYGRVRHFFSGGNVGKDHKISCVSVHIPAGTAAKLRNDGYGEALVVNVSSGRYDPDDDEEVEGF